MATTSSNIRRVAIACQGGGSHTAFTAGVLKQFIRKNSNAYEIVALSGTSGGAICALLAWYGILKIKKGEWDEKDAVRLIDSFWERNAAILPWEILWNSGATAIRRLQSEGMLPEVKISPYSVLADALEGISALLNPRSEFLDLKLLLENHVCFADVDKPIAEPRLLVGAVSVLSGEFKAFDSMKGEINVNAILASSALPWLFEAIKIEEQPYWDGLFSQNPPVKEFVKDADVAEKPDEIWVIRINPQERQREPISTEDIEDRRNELAGNLSLNQELEFIRHVNKWIEDEVLETDSKKIITLRSVEMSPELSSRLSSTTKLDRDESFIRELISDGVERANGLLSDLDG